MLKIFDIFQGFITVEVDSFGILLWKDKILTHFIRISYSDAILIKLKY
jgi:hypothetical protein